MRAGLRFGIAAFAAGLTLAPLPALAQAAPETPTNTSAPESIGPRELQNFSLNGTVTRQAETPAPAPAPARRSVRAGSPDSPAPPAGPVDTASRRPVAPARAPTTEPAARGGQALALDLPPATPATSALPASVPQPGFSSPAAAAPPTLAADSGPALWPWLLLAGVVGAGAALLLLRRRSRQSFAGGPEIDAFVAPEAAPPPRPAPAPAPAPRPEAATPKPVGIVSSRLRPWIDIAFAPLGCTVDDERVMLEFEVQLTNSGGAPARDVLVEASMFNAGPTQEQDISVFFAAPIGQGERIDALPPLQNVTIRTSLVAPRANIQIFELGGRQVFVPLIAFNALYRFGSGSGQTSLAYLLGRETSSDKLGPLRVDLGPRAFTALGIRPLPVGMRT